MMEFGNKQNWKGIFWPAFLFVGVLALPFTLFLSVISLESGDLQFIVTSLVVLSVLWFVVIRHLHSIYTFPYIQMDQNFLVICDPILKRRVYNLDKITNARKVLKAIFFFHNGWPALVNVHQLSLEDRYQVLTRLGVQE